MKSFKMISLLVLVIASALSMQAQRAVLFPTIFGDTVITSTSLDTVQKVITVTAGYSAMGIQVNATKVSGTITAKAYLYSSLDGTNYNLTDSAAAAFANSAGVQSVWFTKTAPSYVYYKVMVRNIGLTGSTESLAVKVYYTLKYYDR